MERKTTNPLIPGFAPDPSVALIGDVFYLVNSSFHVFPGLPIYTSKDLASWTHISNAIDRRSQLSLLYADTNLHPGDDGNTIIATGGLYAPTIRHHDGVTYILCTNVVHDYGGTPGNTQNFLIYTTDINSGKWSDPIYYCPPFQGIDPSILFDSPSSGSKGEKQHTVHAHIQGTSRDFVIHNMEVELDLSALTHTSNKVPAGITIKTISPMREIWRGWDGRYPEGPHIYRRGDWYYLLCAEGGTFNYHMATIARSRGSIWGPYESCPRNPMWTASGTYQYVQHTGHAELFCDDRKSGSGGKPKWWAVMLGVRRRGQRYVMGRETFLTAVEWENEDQWPKFQPVTVEVPETKGESVSRVVGSVDWVYLRDPELDRYEGLDSGRTVRIRASPKELTSPNDTVSFVGKRQRQLEGTAGVTLKISQDGGQVRAGLAMYKDELRFLAVYYDFSAREVVFSAQNTPRKYSAKQAISIKEKTTALVFELHYTENEYSAFYKEGSSDTDGVLLGKVDAEDMTGFDFTGPLIGMFAVGTEDTVVEFNGFQVDGPAKAT